MSTIWYDAYRKLPKQPASSNVLNRVTFGLVAITTFIFVIFIGTTISVVTRSLLPLNNCDPPAKLKESSF